MQATQYNGRLTKVNLINLALNEAAVITIDAHCGGPIDLTIYNTRSTIRDVTPWNYSINELGLIEEEAVVRDSALLLDDALSSNANLPRRRCYAYLLVNFLCKLILVSTASSKYLKQAASTYLPMLINFLFAFIKKIQQQVHEVAR